MLSLCSRQLILKFTAEHNNILSATVTQSARIHYVCVTLVKCRFYDLIYWFGSLFQTAAFKQNTLAETNKNINIKRE